MIPVKFCFVQPLLVGEALAFRNVLQVPLQAHNDTVMPRAPLLGELASEARLRGLATAAACGSTPQSPTVTAPLIVGPLAGR